MCVHAEWETLFYLLYGCENTTFLCEKRDKAFEIGLLTFPHFDRNSPIRTKERGDFGREPCCRPSNLAI